MILALALAAAAAPWSSAQKAGSPAAPPAAQAPAVVQAPEPERLTVNLVNRVPDVDRSNLKAYWPVVEQRAKEQWMQILPQAAKPPLSTGGEVKILGWLHTDGRVTNLALEQRSGTAALDRAAWAAITGSAPFDAFPYGISVNQVRVRFTFTYNEGGEGGSPANGKPGLAGVKPRQLAK